jgi:asparagine synthase (glutamine-hydrolysing)
MCGIAGRFNSYSLPPDPEWHGRADRLLAHRGPDGSGHYSDNFCELVHRRLALIDLSPTGAQPLSNEDGSVLVIFNGEIYNHQELREKLIRQGHVFRGSSDTEVLVHQYEEDGPKLVNRLRGMFAFAIYDRNKRSLLLARDRFGIKPLYYTVLKDQVIFASEIKAILAAAGFVPEIDRQSCYDFLGLSYIPEPASGFAGLHMLSKGSTLVFDAAGEHLETFFKISAQPALGQSLQSIVDLIEEKLLHAVKSQSVADVPVAALLSGGIDSSLVVAAFCRGARIPPTTFNVKFPDKTHDETHVALAVAQHCRTNHRTISLQESAITVDSILDLLRHFDQPFADASLIPTYWVSKAIRDNGIICALSGDGGDEAFGGYAPFWRADRFIRLMGMPVWLQNKLSLLGGYLEPRTRDWGRQLAKAVEFARLGKQDSAVLLAGISNYLSEEQKQELVSFDARASLQNINRCYNGYERSGVSNLEELSLRITNSFFELRLPSDMLRKVDMMSMRASIEVRVPMLDEDVVGLGLTLSHRLKTDGRKGKLVLRGLASRWLPETVAQHPKQGFSIPLDRMANSAFHNMIEDMLLPKTSRINAFMNIGLIRRWLELFRQAHQGKYAGTISREGLYYRILMLLALELWLREHKLSW